MVGCLQLTTLFLPLHFHSLVFLHLFLQTANLLSKASHNLDIVRYMLVNIFHIISYCGPDSLGTLGITQHVVCVLKGSGCWGDGSYHHAAAVSPQGVLQEARQLAVSVGDVTLPIHQSIDAVIKGQKRLVNVGTFLEPDTYRLWTALKW